MAQWINVFRNDGFLNPTRLAIVEPSLTAGRLLGRQNCCKVRKLKLCIIDF